MKTNVFGGAMMIGVLALVFVVIHSVSDTQTDGSPKRVTGNISHASSAEFEIWGAVHDSGSNPIQYVNVELWGYGYRIDDDVTSADGSYTVESEEPLSIYTLYYESGQFYYPMQLQLMYSHDASVVGLSPVLRAWTDTLEEHQILEVLAALKAAEHMGAIDARQVERQMNRLRDEPNFGNIREFIDE